MRPDIDDDQPDPAELQPTDNSAGTPIDLERLDDVNDEADASRE